MGYASFKACAMSAIKSDGCPAGRGLSLAFVRATVLHQASPVRRPMDPPELRVKVTQEQTRPRGLVQWDARPLAEKAIMAFSPNDFSISKQSGSRLSFLASLCAPI